MFFKKRNLRAAYHISQLNGDLLKIASMAMLAKGKTNTKPFSDEKVKAWFDYNLEMTSYGLYAVQSNHGVFDNNTGFEVIYFSLCTNNKLPEYLDETNQRNIKIKNELFNKYAAFLEKPSLNGLSQETINYLKMFDFE